MTKIISITGPSGVGKTTISKIIAVCLGYKDTVIVSGDDSHLWERGDENWKFFTHLNPSSNNLHKEAEHLRNLKNGKSIKRRHYDHSNGKFTEPILIESKEFVIYEGLHTMYGELSELSDISFYIDVDKPLKNKWKIARDSKKRGYSIDQIVKAIENRKQDEKSFIEPQKEKCDVVLKFRESVDNKIEISFDYDKVSLVPLINKIKKMYFYLQDFMDVSGQLSENNDLSQNRGGNMSFLFEDAIIITESGANFSDISYFEGFGFYDLEGRGIFKQQKRASMETPCHLKLGPCCLHTHPLHALAILCSEESDSILNNLFPSAKVLDYYHPGDELSSKIEYHDVLFLKNHGVFVSSSSLKKCLEMTKEIDLKCKKFLEELISKRFLFPDALVLEEDNKFYHSYVEQLINKSGIKPNYLSKKQIKHLQNMEQEKYRSSLE